MRIGEVCGLRWCDVDFETGLISIRHSVAYAKGMGSSIKDTKTHDARGIPIDPVGLLPFLKETHEIDCGKLRLRGLTGAVEIGDCYILSEPGATFATTSYIRRAFKTFSETNGLMGTNDELITFHGLRHTFATQWIRQGEPDTRQTALPRTAFPLTLMLQACNAAASAPFLRQTGTMMNTVP